MCFTKIFAPVQNLMLIPKMLHENLCKTDIRPPPLSSRSSMVINLPPCAPNREDTITDNTTLCVCGGGLGLKDSYIYNSNNQISKLCKNKDQIKHKQITKDEKIKVICNKTNKM